MSATTNAPATRSLRIRIAVIVTAVVASYALIDHAMQRVLVSPRFAALEEQEARQDLARVEQALLAEIDNVDARCRELAASDDTLAFVRDSRAAAGTPEALAAERFVRSNLGFESFENAAVNLLYVVDRDGRVCFGRALDLATGEPLSLRELAYEQLSTSHPMLVKSFDDDAVTPEPIRGLSMLSHGPLFVSSRPILSSRREGPWAGTLIVGRLLSPELVTRLEERTGVEFEVLRLDEGELPAAEAAVVDEVTSSYAAVVQERDDETLAVFTTLADMRRSPALLVRADVPREISQQGATAIGYALVSTIAAGLLLLCVLLAVLRKTVLDPIGALTRHVVELGRTDDMSARVNSTRTDELGVLAREFDSMTEKLERARAQNVEAARTAGMSEIATGILHNVGNVLNSVNVSANVVAARVQGSKLAKLEKLNEMVEAQGEKLGDFIATHPKGKHVGPFLGEVTRLLRGDHDAIQGELANLNEGIEHIRKLVSAQQELAGKSSFAEPVQLEEQIELALSIAARATGEREKLEIVREIAALGRVRLDRHKLVQVLVNLFKNARESIALAGADGRLVVRARRAGERLSIEVEDNGSGIAPENLARVFNHGFTTKPGGHGFGLHSSANAATEMGGRLSAASPGPGRGATFTLALPLESAIHQEESTPCSAKTTVAS